MRKIISLLLRIIISVGILIILIKRIDLSKLIRIVSGADISKIILALLLALLIYFIWFLRWRMLLIGLELNLPQPSIFKSFCLGLFANLFFPSTMGGDVLRSIDLGLRSQKSRQVVASVILDRLSGYSAMMSVAFLALFLGCRIVNDISVLFALSIFLSLLIALLTILFNNFLFSKCSKLLRFFGRTGEALANLHYEIYNFRHQKELLIKNFAFSFIMQLLFVLSVYLISLAFETNVSLIYFFILVPIISAISAIPVSIAGLGLREASSMFFFTKLGMSAEVALAMALLTFAIMFLIGICGGIIYVLTFSRRRL
jgi:hypothetical protein